MNNDQTVLERARNIRLAIFDVDGVLTDGRLYFMPDGTEFKSFNTLDGHGIKMLIAVAFAVVIGTIFGLLSGYVGGWVDTLIVWLMDILLAFPGVLLAIVIVATLGPNLTNALIAISITQVPIYTRIVRSVVMSVRQAEFVQAAKALSNGVGEDSDPYHDAPDRSLIYNTSEDA